MCKRVCDIISTGRMLSTVHKLTGFVTRVNDTVKHILWQLCCLYPIPNTSRQNDTPVISIQNVHLSTIWEALGECLVMLYTLDMVFFPPQGLEGTSGKFREHWDQYKRLLVSIQNAASGQFPDADRTKLKPFERLMQKWEGQLLEGRERPKREKGVSLIDLCYCCRCDITELSQTRL